MATTHIQTFNDLEITKFNVKFLKNIRVEGSKFAKMEVEIISKEAIKPSKPTPSHRKLHKLSSLDQLSPSIYVPVLLFYRAPSTPHDCVSLSSQLKSSLSETLTHYYPFVGKVIKDGVHIDCDDKGALFLVARAKNNLVDILTLPKLKALSMLFPDDLQWKSSKNSSVLAVQVCNFDCGGLSIGICISRKIADACTIFTFLNDWATYARKTGNSDLPSICPLFNTALSIFPPSDQIVVPELEFTIANVVTRRYVFHSTKISELKANIVSNSKILENPTRVEVVTSLIYKSIIQANKIRSLGLVKTYMLAQTVNMRPLMVPSLPRNTIGNIDWYFLVMITDNDDRSLESLATQMRESFLKLCDAARNVREKGWLLMSGKLENDGEHSQDDAYKFSSWCRYPIYEVDFGWGSPAIWVSTAEYPYKNSVIMMDSKDGEGIEAWVTLDEDVMYVFQSDEELLKFASLNPSIYDNMQN